MAGVMEQLIPPAHLRRDSQPTHPPTQLTNQPTTLQARWMFSRPACLELTHNHGTESDASFAGYCNGNVDPGRGFGHIGCEGR